MDLLRLFTFILSNLAVLITAFLIVMKLYKYRIESLLKVIIGTFTLFCAEIIIVEILLGIFGAISYINVSIFVYLLLLLSLVIFGKNKIVYERVKTQKVDVLKLAIIFTIPIFLLAVKYFNTIFQIPLEYDSVAYHLPFTVEWLQTGSLTKLYYSVFAGPIAYYPSNHELLTLWTILPFRNDFFTQLINFPLFAFLTISLYKTLRNLNIDKTISILCSSIPLYMPVFLYQAGTSLVDLFFISFFVTSIFYLQEIFKNEKINITDFCLLGTATGLFIGTKYLGLVYGPIIFSAAIIFLIYQKIRRSPSVFKSLIGLFIPLILTGSFFYIRNWIDSGNPIFPVDINILGIHFLEGYKGINANLLSTSLVSNLHSLASIKNFLITFLNTASPFGVIWIFLSIMNLGLLVKQFLSKKTNHNDISLNILLTITLPLFFFLYIKSPYTFKDMTQNIRYAMPFLIIGCLDIGYLVSRIKFSRSTFYATSCLIFAYSLKTLYTNKLLLNLGTLRIHKEYILIGTLGLLAMFFAIQINFTKRKKTLITLSIALVSLSIFLETTLINFAYKERELPTKNSSDLIEASKWLDVNAPKAKIAYSGFNYHYHLYGRDLSREVDYVNINECSDCRYVDYKNSIDSVRRDPDYKNWLNNLKAKEKKYLVVSTDKSKVKNYEFEWATNNAKIFKEVFNKNDIYIFNIEND